MAASSQDLLPFYDIQNDLVFLNNGSVSAVLQTSAVNFGLLSEIEQVSIIEAFAGLLNSLSFNIQIVIHSQRLDVSSYLTTLDAALKNQTNPLLASLIPRYRKFVEQMIKENDVLDKQFYIVLNVSVPELGLTSKSVDDKTKKAVTILTPRIDHMIRQLSRIGLKSQRLKTVDLVTFFYTTYNARLDSQPLQDSNFQVPQQAASIPQPVTPPVQPTPTAPTQVPSYIQPNYAIPRPQQTFVATPAPQPPQPLQTPTLTRLPQTQNLVPPFVVEELHDDYRP